MTKYAVKSIVTMACEIAMFIYTGAMLVVKGICGNVKSLLQYI